MKLKITHSHILTIFQSCTLSILHSNTIPILQSYTLPILHPSNSNLTLFQSYTLTLFQSCNLTLHHYNATTVKIHKFRKIMHSTVQQAGVAAQKKIWEPPDMSLLHYFLNDQLSLSDSVLS